MSRSSSKITKTFHILMWLHRHHKSYCHTLDPSEDCLCNGLSEYNFSWNLHPWSFVCFFETLWLYFWPRSNWCIARGFSLIREFMLHFHQHMKMILHLLTAEPTLSRHLLNWQKNFSTITKLSDYLPTYITWRSAISSQFHWWSTRAKVVAITPLEMQRQVNVWGEKSLKSLASFYFRQ